MQGGLEGELTEIHGLSVDLKQICKIVAIRLTRMSDVNTQRFKIVPPTDLPFDARNHGSCSDQGTSDEACLRISMYLHRERHTCSLGPVLLLADLQRSRSGHLGHPCSAEDLVLK